MVRSASLPLPVAPPPVMDRRRSYAAGEPAYFYGRGQSPDLVAPLRVSPQVLHSGQSKRQPTSSSERKAAANGPSSGRQRSTESTRSQERAVGPVREQQPASSSSMALTPEEELLLCGVMPGTSKAVWYVNLKAQLEQRDRLPGSLDDGAPLQGMQNISPVLHSSFSDASTYLSPQHPAYSSAPLLLPPELLTEVYESGRWQSSSTVPGVTAAKVQTQRFRAASTCSSRLTASSADVEVEVLSDTFELPAPPHFQGYRTPLDASPIDGTVTRATLKTLRLSRKELQDSRVQVLSLCGPHMSTLQFRQSQPPQVRRKV